jgi:hypothetical protein
MGEILGVSAAALQVFAYCVYIRLFIRGEIRPNAASWLMFAYGTALMTFLEWRNQATRSELLLPIACSSMSVIVAVLCLRQRATEPIQTNEKVVFGADLLLTVLYVVAGLILVRSQEGLATAFLLAGNVTTVTSFAPLVRSTWLSPTREDATPWWIWTVAYATLFMSSVISTGVTHVELLLYPGLCALLHGLVAFFSQRKHDPVVELRPSPISGQGIHAKFPLATGVEISVLTGRVQRGIAQSHPNSIGVDKDLWIYPDFPLQHINHSCEPNSAFVSDRSLVAIRPISGGEEITLDYSTTEVDPDWSMTCACGAANCRGVLRAIQIDFAHAASAPQANPAMVDVWHAERHLHQTDSR